MFIDHSEPLFLKRKSMFRPFLYKILHMDENEMSFIEHRPYGVYERTYKRKALMYGNVMAFLEKGESDIFEQITEEEYLIQQVK